MKVKVFIGSTISLCLFVVAAFGCPACEKQQPKLLQGITHGAGPGGFTDYIIIGIATAIVLVTLFFSIKWLINPGEKKANHIKQFILNID